MAACLRPIAGLRVWIGGAVTLIVDHLNAMLNRVGQNWSWRRAYRCPCVQAATNQANPTCPVCAGKGWTWTATGVPGVAGTAGATVQKQWKDFGSFEAGDVVISVGSDSPLYAIGPYDRVRQVDADEPFSIVWQPGQILKFVPKSLDRAFYVGAAIVDLPVPSVNAAGVVTWPTAPPAKTPVSLTGRRPVEYFVYQDVPVSRQHQRGDALPRKVVLRRFDALGR